MNRETPWEGRIVRRFAYQDFVIARCEVPAVIRFVESLQDSRIDRNRDSLRFTRSECDALPSHQPFERFVCAYGKLCVHFRDLRTRTFAGVLDGKAHCLSG
jgi:hypothetical protein